MFRYRYPNFNHLLILFQATNIENADEEQDEDEVTKPPLTGIPQIDYVWDPNLPRELNG